MSASSDPHSRLKDQSDLARGGFLKTELELGFTFSSLAAAKFDTGNSESAEGSIASAEKVYETVNRFLNNPKHSSDLTVEEIHDMRDDLERLRERLDSLAHRFKR
jgi:hypothetical protein